MKIYFLKWIIGIFSIVCFLSGFTNPSRDLINRVEKVLKTYRVNYGPEKIYVHHDKLFYGVGEIVWLKIHVLDASTLKATQKSGIVYVNLLNEQKDLVHRLILPIADGVAHGDLMLREDLTKGVYHLVAFTQWARNFGEENFFQKEIYIHGPEKEDLWPPKDLLDPVKKSARIEQYRYGIEERKIELQEESKPLIDLQFFPEGGDLIEGLSTEVAFKAVDSTGYGISFTGALFDKNRNKLLDFQDSHLGMGSFKFKPEPSEEYFAELTLKDGQTFDFPLPEVSKHGYVLHMDEITDKDNILVRISTNTEEKEPLKLFAICREELLHMEEVVPMISRDFETQIPKSIFSDGIVRFTLAKENGDSLAERLVFVRHEEKTKLEVQTDKPVYYPREEVNVMLGMKGNSVETSNLTHLSMAVTREDFSSPLKKKENIQTYLLLSSDLRGQIESPAYYFENNELERQKALRTVMMTHGWRRFDWKAMLTQEFPIVQFVNELVLDISGKLVKSNGLPVSKGEIILYVKDQYDTYITTTTDEDGVFSFYNLKFEDYIQVVIQGTDDRGRSEDLEIHIFNREHPDFSDKGILLPKKYTRMLPENFGVDFDSALLDMESWEEDFDETKLKDMIVDKEVEFYHPMIPHEQAGLILDREQLLKYGSANILACMQGNVDELRIRKSGSENYRAFFKGQSIPPLYLVNGRPTTERTIQNIPHTNIERVEIIQNPKAKELFGKRARGGVISLLTDSDYKDEFHLDDVTNIILYQAFGFHKTRQFYSPVYNTADYYALPDMRSTIYWDPMLSLKNNESKSLSFYSADSVGTYTVTLEGITQDGQPVRKVTSFEVQNSGF